MDLRTADADIRAGRTRPGGRVDFANWLLYMDPRQPELAAFTEQTGIEVCYHEVIDGMQAWYTRIQPLLAEGRSIDCDLMIVTNGLQFQQLAHAGLLLELDHSLLPNVAANIAASYQDRPYDPGNVYSVPWASGITGIAYNPAFVDEAPTALADLWDQRFAGKVGMYADTLELGSFGMLALGIDPATSTQAQWEQAAAHLRRQRDSGNVHRYYRQSDVDALERGELLVMQAWSGDIFQKNLADGTDLQFVLPAEGGTIWTDNFTIPVTAANPLGAQALVDFFYRPQVAASLTEYINYITPVPAAQEVIRSHAAAAGPQRASLAAVAESRLVFPTPADYHNLYYYRAFRTTAERRTYESIFSEISR